MLFLFFIYKKIEEIQTAVEIALEREKEAKQPAGHNNEDEDISKIAPVEVIGKTTPVDNLSK
mgnify:CR=1 FL=1